MRDKNRIKPFMEKLTELWEELPDYRFFQLINLLTDGQDLFYQEDNKSLKYIEGLASDLQKEKYYKDNKSEIYEYVLEKVIKVFKDKVDKGGNPYINHLLFVSEKQKNIDAKIIGLLHDILEDTDTTEQELKLWGIPESIIKEIKLLTRVQGQNYKEYIAKIKTEGSLDVLSVKLADLEHNMDISRVKDDDMRVKVKNLIEKRYKPVYEELTEKYNKKKLREEKLQREIEKFMKEMESI